MMSPLESQRQSTARVTDYEHDFFVSYARVDDEPLFGADQGWVSTLVRDLRNLLPQKMGRLESLSILWDESELRGNHDITPEIQNALRKSATLLLVLSPGYLASRWCMQEKAWFLQQLGGEPRGRVFVVERQVLDEPQRVPDDLVDIKGYRFWYRDDREQPRTLRIHDQEPHKTKYIRLVDDLANDISARLKTLRTAAPPSKPKATIFLAEVTDDLDGRREKLRRFLEPEFRVLPTLRYLEGAKFRQALEEGLEQSGLFVQLLSEYPGRRPPDIPQGYARLQLEEAQARQLQVLQWRHTDLVLDDVESEAQRELLDGGTVYAESLEGFKQRVVAKAIPPPPSTVLPPNPTPVVFINFEGLDRDLAQVIRDHVDERLVATLPIGEGTPSQVRKDRNHKLLLCDALIVVYGDGTHAWVDRQLLICNKIRPKRNREFHALGVYDGPPENKPEVSTRLPGLEVLTCREGFNEHKLQAFLAPLLQAIEA